jgi:hypothetical protein
MVIHVDRMATKLERNTGKYAALANITADGQVKGLMYGAWPQQSDITGASSNSEASKQTNKALFWGHNRTYMLQKDGHNSIMKYKWKV